MRLVFLSFSRRICSRSLAADSSATRSLSLAFESCVSDFARSLAMDILSASHFVLNAE